MKEDLSTRQHGPELIADDGDEFNFCSTCVFAAACLDSGYDKSRLRELHVLVEHTGPYRPGEHIFREGDEFNAVAGIRAGTVKTYVTDLAGREQVRGFFLPGEVIGLNAISRSRYPVNAVALDSVMLCRFSFPKIATLAGRMPALQQQLFRLLSEDIGKAALPGERPPPRGEPGRGTAGYAGTPGHRGERAALKPGALPGGRSYAELPRHRAPATQYHGDTDARCVAMAFERPGSQSPIKRKEVDA